MPTNEPAILDVLFCVDGLASSEETLALSQYLAAHPDQAAYFDDILGYSVTEVLETRVGEICTHRNPAESELEHKGLPEQQSQIVTTSVPQRLRLLKTPLTGLAAIILLVLVTLPLLTQRPAQAAQNVIQLARVLATTTLVSTDSRETGVAEAVRLIERLRTLPRQSGVVECDRQLAMSALLRLLALQEAEGRNSSTVRSDASNTTNSDTLLGLAGEAISTCQAAPDHPERRWQKEDEILCALHVRATLALEAAFTVGPAVRQQFYLRCVDDAVDAIARMAELAKNATVPEEFAARWRLLRQDSLLLLGRALIKGDFSSEAERLERIKAMLPELVSVTTPDLTEHQPPRYASASQATRISLALLQHVAAEQGTDPRTIVIRATALNSIGLMQKRSSAPQSLQQALQTLTSGIALLESLRSSPSTGLRKQVFASGVEQSPLLILGKLCGNAADSQQIAAGFEDQVRYGRQAENALTEALHANRDDEIIKSLGWIQTRLLIALWRMNLHTPQPETLVRIHATAHSLRLFSNEFTDFDGFSINRYEQAICHAIAADVFRDMPLTETVVAAGLEEFSTVLQRHLSEATEDPENSRRELQFFCGLLRDVLQLPAYQVPGNAALLQQLQDAENI